jgi:hypothetical protein
MPVGAIASAGDSADLFDLEDSKCTLSLWKGRDVELLTRKSLNLTVITQFYADALKHTHNMANVQIDCRRHYELLDISEEISEEISSNFDRIVESAYRLALHHPTNREFTLADLTQYRAEFAQCGLIAAAGAGAADGARKKREDEEDPEPHNPSAAPPPSDIPLPSSENPARISQQPHAGGHMAAAPSAPSAGDPPSGRGDHFKNALTSFLENLQNGKIDPVSKPDFDLFHKSDGSKQENDAAAAQIVSFNIRPPSLSATANFLETLWLGYATSLSDCPTLFALPPVPTTPMRSCHVQTAGVKMPGMGSGFINGMNTSFFEHVSHLDHIKKFAGDMSIDGVYNHSNGAVADVGEIFFINYPGIAPVTSDLLLENWTRFHEENKNNPDAKYLQFTHSMGNILARDALMKAPKEIRDRVIVVATAPAAIIPKWLCYDSYHYASKRDVIHYGEDLHTHFTAEYYDESERQDLYNRLLENKQQLILLDPHPGAKGIDIDHKCESPTFDEVFERHFNEYLVNKGQYR